MRRKSIHSHDRLRRPLQRRAFTLLEVLMASVVLSLAVAAISQAVVSGQLHTYASLHRMRGTALAQALMAEVTALPYPVVAQGHTAPPKPNSRLLYDSMDDFDGYIEAAGALRDQAGREYDQPYQTFNRQVSVTAKSMTINGLGKIDGLEVAVHVIDQQGQSTTLIRFVPSPNGQASGAGP